MNRFSFTECFPLPKAVGRGFSITKKNGQKYQASPPLLKA